MTGTIFDQQQAALRLDDFEGTPEQEKRFAEFHAAHPQVWQHFERFCFEVLARGYRRYSADAVMHRVRWETSSGAKSGLKINNNFVSYYARLWRRTHPQHRSLFAVRRSKADRGRAAA